MPYKQRTVIIVDDDEEFIAELGEALAASGYIPLPFGRGHGLLALVRRVRPAAIFLDLKLGGENGLDIAERLRRDRTAARIPIIMMSGYFRDPANCGRLPPSNINVYLQKPFSQRSAIKSLQGVMAGREEVEENLAYRQILYHPDSDLPY